MEVKHYLGIELKLADFEITHWLFWQNEWWQYISGYEGLYSVSTLGRVQSFDRIYERIIKGTKCTIIANGKNLRLQTRKNGYKWAMLYKNSKPKCCNVHRLVMLAFRGSSNMIVNHKDLDKGNNKLCNLEYCTARDNCIHFLESVQTKTNEIGIHFKKQKKTYEVRITHLGIRWKLCGFVDIAFAIEVRNKYFGKVLDCISIDEVKAIKAEINSIYKNKNGTNKFSKRGQINVISTTTHT